MACTIRYLGKFRTNELNEFFEDVTGEVMILPYSQLGSQYDVTIFEVIRHNAPAASQGAPPTSPVAPQQQGNQCAKCGQLNGATARFCTKCGSSIQ